MSAVDLSIIVAVRNQLSHNRLFLEMLKAAGREIIHYGHRTPATPKRSTRWPEKTGATGHYYTPTALDHRGLCIPGVSRDTSP